MKILNFLMSLIGFGRCETPQSVPVPVPVGRRFVIPVALSVTMPIPEKPVSIPVRQLTCISVNGSKKKVRFVTRRGQLMAAEIAGWNGGGEVLLRRPNHRFGPIFRRVLTV